jgi:hypothetical protein
MKMKLKMLAAAAALAVAGQASAALSDTFVTDGTLFLTVWDVTTNKSYVRDLGVSISGFTPTGALVSDAGNTTTFGNLPGSTLFSTTFAGATASNLRWTVIGVDQVESDGNGARYVSTFASAPTVQNGQVRNVAGITVNFAGELINNSGVDFTGAPAEYATSESPPGSTSGGGAGWGPALAGTGNNHLGTGFGSAQFWYAATTTSDGSANSTTATTQRFGNSAFFSSFTLNSDGTLVYSLDPAGVTAVPLPAAAWLMGAGLLGLGGAARRRKAAKAAA